MPSHICHLFYLTDRLITALEDFVVCEKNITNSLVNDGSSELVTMRLNSLLMIWFCPLYLQSLKYIL
jgi:hypothetical protein